MRSSSDSSVQGEDRLNDGVDDYNPGNYSLEQYENVFQDVKANAVVPGGPVASYVIYPICPFSSSVQLMSIPLPEGISWAVLPFATPSFADGRAQTSFFWCLQGPALQIRDFLNAVQAAQSSTNNITLAHGFFPQTSSRKSSAERDDSVPDVVKSTCDYVLNSRRSSIS